MSRCFLLSQILTLAVTVMGCGHDTNGGTTDGSTSDGSTNGSDGCANTCPEVDETRCNGDLLEVCKEGTSGCLEWAELEDCAASGKSCDPSDAIAICNGLLCPEPHGRALALNGSGDHVTMGPSPGLGLGTFTLEAWIRPSLGGETASSGVGGVDGIPLITKGRGESDGSTVDCNYFFGIDAASRTLVADFEDMSSGANHPVQGATALLPDRWYHVAATYDGSTWRLFLDGEQDGMEEAAATPRYDSIQHFGLGTALNSEGTPSGFFAGTLDEVRVWGRALSKQEISASLTQENPTADGLVARWALEETSGSSVPETGGVFPGTLAGGEWVDPGAPFAVVGSLAEPMLISPADGAVAGMDSATLSVWVDGDDDAPLEVVFQGRQVGEDFAMVLLPDTQYYSESYPETFMSQTTWIRENQALLNIRAVLHEGDITDNGDTYIDQWYNADAAMTVLETPLPGLPDGIPFGLAVGNHDETPNGDPNGTTTYFNQFFGVERFEGRSYYGGHLGSTNNHHFITFEAGQERLLALFMAFDPAPDAEVLSWARQVLLDHSDRRAILTAHYLIGTGEPGTWSSQGQTIYEALRDVPNLELMVCGHIHGEGQRTDTFEGHTIRTMLADYQSWSGGGSGYLRILFFSPIRAEIRVRTYSTLLDLWEVDPDSDFVIPFRPQAEEFSNLGSVTIDSPQEAVTYEWTDLDPGSVYQWSATVRSCVSERTSRVFGFQTAPGN